MSFLANATSSDLAHVEVSRLFDLAAASKSALSASVMRIRNMYDLAWESGFLWRPVMEEV
jgi:hypothetical protein